MMHSKWKQTAPGIWSAKEGEPCSLSAMSVMNRTPKTEALTAMKEAVFPLDADKIRIEATARQTIITLPLEPEEKLYGLGLQLLKLNHRGRTRYLRVNSDPKQDTGETHAPVPFYVSSKGYGVMVNTSRIVSIYCGSAVRLDSGLSGEAKDRNADKSWKATPVSDTVEIVIQEPGAELFIFGGPTPLDAVRRYNLFHGGGVLPPKWGLGFWHRVPKAYTDEQVVAEAMSFREREFPCDVIGLEPGWHSKSYPVTYEWNRERFPDPEGFVRRMAEEGFQINLWEHPYVSPDASIYEPLKPLSGSHTVWHGLVPDYTLESAREIYMKQHETEHVDIGVSGYKLDECDGSELTRNSWIYPAHATFPSGADGEQVRQLYGLMIQKMTDDVYRSKNRRTYGLARASSAAASSLPYVLYSDLYDHRQFVRGMCSSSFSGLLWTPEVRKARNAEDWVRRMQVVCFSPLAMVNAWADGTKPWSFPEVEAIVKKYITLRMRLMPYLYSAFARYCFEGIPPIRAMQLESGTDSSLAGGEHVLDSTDFAYGGVIDTDVDDQFMVGDSLLVAPLFEGESERDVYLPAGVWYDFETGERWEGGRTIRVSTGLDRIPVFVKNGAILPMMPVMQHAPAAGESVDLELHHYGDAPGRFQLFDDDGVSFAYETGAYRWRTLEARAQADGTLSGNVSAVDEEWSSSYRTFTWISHHRGE
ncbi:TIM-barrel domain-containing protein [Paenibacillus sp. OAS669]|uniref:glycoside hydrolase family 31 protein n=1 Tax=Paenibacillus sp. OAS669 TaxID=2663821 RepID=UPI00178AC0F1|nr:TIM-barrel domain-containing protein [Paenibacillus sp. OAS669]MBE1443427.1 alpha-D-xyloside xylohydrolase [Paenibacillus sp. OAS669]